MLLRRPIHLEKDKKIVKDNIKKREIGEQFLLVGWKLEYSRVWVHTVQAFYQVRKNICVGDVVIDCGGTNLELLPK